jgi:hypothetical protein
MKSVPALVLERYRLLFVLGLAVLYLTVFSATTGNFEALQKTGGKVYPFGIFVTRDGGFFLQDFSYNMLFLRGIHERLVDRPYSMQGQVEMVRKLLPEARSGLHHAYSPVAFVLTLLLPYVSNFQAYVVYFIITGVGILLLTYFYLLPNATHLLQIGALAVTLPSFCTTTALAIGQTAMLTTVLLAAFWVLLRRSSHATHGLVGIDFALAVIFWAICFKPSIAVVPFFLMVGAQSWRALIFSLGLLLVTWDLLAGYYGGWWTGLQDYFFLVGHYNHGLIPPFDDSGNLAYIERTDIARTFAYNRAMLTSSCAILVLLRWSRLLTMSEMFQLLVWVFVLFSPYLLPSEDWILCLLIVEGLFFKSRQLLPAVIKLLLLAVIFNLRSNVGLPEYFNFPAVLILFVWLVIEIIRLKGTGQHSRDGASGTGKAEPVTVA